MTILSTNLVFLNFTEDYKQQLYDQFLFQGLMEY